MKRRIATGWWVMAGVLVACSGTDNRLGGTAQQGERAGTGGGSHASGTGGSMHAGTGGTAGASTPAGGMADPTSRPVGFGDPAAQHDVAGGKWTGYIENYQGSDGTVTVEFDALSDTSVTGRIIFGDANAPVPDYSDPHPYIGNNVGGEYNNGFPVESYPFSLLEGTRDGNRIQFSLDKDEIWQAWCVEQSPIPDRVNPGIYHCVENEGWSYDQNGCYFGAVGGPPADCSQLSLCMTGPCACDATSCSIRGDGPHFDMSMQGDRMDGSVARLVSPYLNVHLTKN